MCGRVFNSQILFYKIIKSLILIILFSPVIAKAQSIQLNWMPDDSPNITNYRVYRSIQNNTNFLLIDTISHPDSSYIDENIEFDTRYFYVATSVDHQGNESSFSNEIEIVMPKAYLLTISSNLENGGSIEVDNQKTKYVEGEQVTVTAHANSGFQFDCWSGAVAGNDSVLTITMNSNINITANFIMTSVGISGNINYVNSHIPICNTQVNLTGGFSENQTPEVCSFSETQSADECGYYQFNSLQSGSNCSISPTREKCDEGMSIISYDAALTARIAMNLMDASEVSKVAADVNKDGNVQMYDASLIAMKAVGLAPRSDSYVGDWGFYPANRTYNSLDTEYNNQNFTATILGDVDGNWQPCVPLEKSKTPKRIYADLTDKEAQPGSQITIPFIAENNKDIFSFDISMNYDFHSLKYVGMIKREAIANFQIFENNSEKGSVKIGGFSVQAMQAADVYLELVFEVIGRDGSQSQLELNCYRINADPEQCATSTLIIGNGGQTDLPQEYVLYNNYPNPFNPETNIKYEIPENSNVTIKIYNMLGHEVKTLINEEKTAGIYQVQWDGRDDSGQFMASGMYVYRLFTDDFIASRKMSLMK